MNKILTIFIPTYNRATAVMQLLDEIITSDLISIVKVVVIDDCSQDDTYDRLISVISNDDVIILRNNKNLGVTGTTLRFIKICKTEYFIQMADDDMLNRNGIIKLISFIKSVKPDFVSTAWGMWDKDNNWKNTMRTNGTNSRILFKDIRRASNHDPGILFKTSACNKHLEILQKWNDDGCYATYIWGSVVMVLLIAFSNNNNCWWFKEVVGGYRPYGALPSLLRDAEGGRYTSVVGRWKEQISFQDIYEYIYNNSEGDNKKIAQQLLIKHNSELFDRIFQGINSERPDLAEVFLVKSFLTAIRSPVITMKSLFKYLLFRSRYNNY